jgi:excisionase family DNA binding protein
MDEQQNELMTVSGAARALGLTRQRVLQLISAGDFRALRSGRQWLISRPDVERRKQAASPSGGHFSPYRAWGVLFLADGLEAPWLDRSARWTLKRQLSEHRLADLRPRLGARGRRRYLRAHSSDIQRIGRERGVIRTGASAQNATNIVAPGHLEAYVTSEDLSAIASRYHLTPSWDANVVVREIPRVVASHIVGVEAPTSAVALDLLEEDDPRSQEIGQQLLARYR